MLANRDLLTLDGTKQDLGKLFRATPWQPALVTVSQRYKMPLSTPH